MLGMQRGRLDVSVLSDIPSKTGVILGCTVHCIEARKLTRTYEMGYQVLWYIQVERGRERRKRIGKKEIYRTVRLSVASLYSRVRLPRYEARSRQSRLDGIEIEST